MKVGIDGRFIGGRETGVGRATRLLVDALARSGDPGDALHVWRGPCWEARGKAASGLQLHRAPMAPTRHPWTEIWESVCWKKRLGQLGISLLHTPSFRTPWISGIPRITTIYDLAALSVPKTIPFKFRIYLRASIRGSLRRASLVICPTQAVRKEIEERFPLRTARIEVVHLGTPPLPQLCGEEAKRRRRALGIPDLYIVATGAGEPRKNHDRLLRAMARFSRGFSGTAPALVVIGGKARRKKTIVDIEKSTVYTIVTGYLGLDDLSALYGGAAALAYVSTYEGFGLPILEAMSCGTPVVTSGFGATKEVAGPAALLVDPFSTDSIHEALRRLFADPGIGAVLRQKGYERTKGFSWEACARRTWELYRSLDA